MEYSNSTKRMLYLLIIIMVALLGKKMRDYGIYEHLDVKKVCDYTQKRKNAEGQYLYMTDEVICVWEYIEESGNIESVKVSSFRKYLSNPEKTYEILYFDSKKWALDSSLTEQILYDERYKEKLIDDATYIEITNGKCMWSGPKVNKKSFFPGILQTSMVLRIRDSEDKTNSEHSFKYVIKK